MSDLRKSCPAAAAAGSPGAARLRWAASCRRGDGRGCRSWAELAAGRSVRRCATIPPPGAPILPPCPGPGASSSRASPLRAALRPAAGAGSPPHRRGRSAGAAGGAGASLPAAAGPDLPALADVHRLRRRDGRAAGRGRGPLCPLAAGDDGRCERRPRPTAARRDPRRRLRRALRGQGAGARPGARHAGRPPQPPPVPAAALPGGHRGAQSRATSPRRSARCSAGQQNVEVLLAEADRSSTWTGARCDLSDGAELSLRLPDRRDRRPALLLRPRRLGAAGARASRPSRTRSRSGAGCCWPSSGPSASPTGAAARLADVRRRRRRPDRRGDGRRAGRDPALRPRAGTSATSTPARPRVMLLEGGPRLLPAYPPKLERQGQGRACAGSASRCAPRPLVTDVRPGLRCSAAGWIIPTQTVIWAAGNVASPLLKSLGVPLDRAGRVHRRARLHHPRASRGLRARRRGRVPSPGRQPLPGICPVAIQMGEYAARTIWAISRARRAGRSTTGTRGSSR